MDNSFVNSVTAHLKPYPMEELAKARQRLRTEGKKVYDFGTGDPRIPTSRAIVEAARSSIDDISQYPSARGSEELRHAFAGYLQRRFNFSLSDKVAFYPTRGSKEAVFHLAQSIVGRAGKRSVIYPNPGYPVYRSSTLFAGGVPVPVSLTADEGYLLKPWELPESVQNDAAAVWLNYPHNPTGALASESYWREVIDWAHNKDCLVLSDDCYIDIYNAAFDSPAEVDKIPVWPLSLTTDRIVSLLSLSKRSGMTGYRSGFMIGDTRFMTPHLRARANFGIGNPAFIQSASVAAWSDDTHVADRRRIFSERLQAAGPRLQQLGVVKDLPDGAFYLWCQVPASFKGDDVQFSLQLAELGVIVSPSQWLSEGIKGYFRLALVPEVEETAEALQIIETFINERT